MIRSDLSNTKYDKKTSFSWTRYIQKKKSTICKSHRFTLDLNWYTSTQHPTKRSSNGILLGAFSIIWRWFRHYMRCFRQYTRWFEPIIPGAFAIIPGAFTIYIRGAFTILIYAVVSKLYLYAVVQALYAVLLTLYAMLLFNIISNSIFFHVYDFTIA
jgi:hypothetical protein